MAELIIKPIEKFGLSKDRTKKSSLFSRVGVVGCGKEGSYIVTVAASNGLDVVFWEPSEQAITDAFNRIEKKLDKRIEGWGLTQSEKKAIMARIKGTSYFADFAGCEFVIEALRYDDSGVRHVEGRKEVFQKLESILSEEAIIASNVSTIVVTELATQLKHSDRCIGVHFMPNVPGSAIIEIVPSVTTSEATFDRIVQFVKFINHQYVVVQESAGLVTLRLLFAQLNEACSILMEGIASIEDIDKILTVGYGHRQGVFRTADQIGIEKIIHLMDNMYEEYGSSKYKPSPVLKRLYRAGHFGISKRKGFYTYDENGNIVK